MLHVLWPAAAVASTVGWDDDDFLISGFDSNTIGVFDHDLTFKGNLVTGFDRVTGLDFDAAGNLVAVGRGPGQVRVFSPEGMQLSSFVNSDIQSPVDVRVGPSGDYYVGGILSSGFGVMEFTPDGTTGRTFDTDLFATSLAVLPGGVLWVSGGSPLDGISVFDISNGNDVGTINFDNGQFNARTMRYSQATETVLMLDSLSGVFERQINGDFVRSFTADGVSKPVGITRGPNDDVFVTDEDNNGVYRWRADGTFVGFTPLGGGLDAPVSILWTGNSPTVIPEPAAATCCLAILGLAMLRRRAS
ncbi:MAG: hypothetical protein AAF561_08435 [Planctomycetota bacterium]